MGGAAVVSITSVDHLHAVGALAASLREHHPELPLFACVMDPGEAELPADAGVEWFAADQLPLDDWRRTSFQYTGLELACALKPWALARVLGLGFERVLYLDGDVAVFGRLDPVLSGLDAASISLAPHLPGPLPKGSGGHERAVLRSGAYNGGALGLRRSPEADAFLAWWRRMLARHCIHDIAAGVDCDQGYLDLVPGLFDGVRIEREPGWNVAYWNLPGRSLTGDPTRGFEIDGRPLRSFHFSGFDPARPDEITQKGRRREFDDAASVRALARHYAGRLETAGRERWQAHGYGHARLAGGAPIDPLWREAVRLRHPLLEDVADPFDDEKTPDLVARFEAAARDVALSREDWKLRLLRGRRSEDLEFLARHPWLARLARTLLWGRSRRVS
jgi:hypothetical protein